MMRAILCFLFLLSSATTFAQKSIKGRVVDSENNPIEWANVLIFSEKDTLKLLQGTVTDSLGNFGFKQIDAGNYWLKIQIVGFRKTAFWVQKHDLQDLLLNTIVLEKDSRLLDAVEVIGQKEVIQKNNNGFTINAAATLSQQGGTAVDLLRNSPAVFVDAEGSVILRGKAPLILINGRNSKLTNPANIPASSIEKIEIITNPSAEYDAEAENGIINIILKKGTQQGLNGAFALGTGRGAKGRFNSSALLNYKQGNWNIGLAYDNRIAQRTRSLTGDRVNFNFPEKYFLTQRRQDDRTEESHNLRFNLDFERNRNRLNFEVIHSIEKDSNYETLFSTFETKNGDFVSKNRRFSEEISSGNVTELALNFERKLSKDNQKLTLNLTSSLNYGTEKTAINTQSLTSGGSETGSPFLQKTAFIDKSQVSNLRIDYQQKIGKGLWQTGYKGILRLFSDDFKQENQINGEFRSVGIRTGILEFDEQIHALYTQYKLPLSVKWDLEAGLRAEQTLNNGTVKSLNIQFSNRYANLFPSLNIGYKLSDNQNIRFLYAQRINRPRLGQLDPFTDITDSLTQRSGNPKLQPEITDNVELAYAADFSKAAWIAKLFYRNGKNTILPFTVLRPDGVLFTQPENVGTTKTIGLESIFSYTPVSFWQGNMSFSLFHQAINAGNIQAEALNEVLSWNVKWLNDFNLWKNTKWQVIGVYNSPTATVQGVRVAVYNVDFAFQQKLWNDKGRIGIIVTDIFNTQVNGSTWETREFTFKRVSKIDTRAVLVTFAYTFGTKFREKLMENRFLNE